MNAICSERCWLHACGCREGKEVGDAVAHHGAAGEEEGHGDDDDLLQMLEKRKKSSSHGARAMDGDLDDLLEKLRLPIHPRILLWMKPRSGSQPQSSFALTASTASWSFMYQPWRLLWTRRKESGGERERERAAAAGEIGSRVWRGEGRL